MRKNQYIKSGAVRFLCIDGRMMEWMVINDAALFKLKAQSDELLLEFGQLVGTEMRQIESMTTKSHRLLRLFQQDYYEFSENLNENVRTLAEFQKDFDSIDQNFDEIEELSRKSKMMKNLVKDVMKRYDNGSLSGKKKAKGAAR